MIKEEQLLRRTNSGIPLVTINNSKINQEEDDKLSLKHLSQSNFFQTNTKPRCGGVKLTNTEQGNEFNIIFLERNNIKSNAQSSSLSNENQNSKYTIPMNSNSHYNKNESCDLCNVDNSSQSEVSNRKRGMNDFQAKFISTLTDSQQLFEFNPIVTDNNNKEKENQREEEELSNPLDKEDSILYSKYVPNAKISNTNQNDDKIQLITSNSVHNEHNNDLYQRNMMISSKSSANAKDKEVNNDNAKEQQHLNTNNSNNDNLFQDINIIETDNQQAKEYKTEFSFSPNHITRRYKQNDIATKKAFFEMRYLNHNLKNMSKIANSIKTKEPIVDEANKQRNFYFYVDNRNVMKYTSLYWKKMDTAIFQFNNKQFEKSYRHLIEENIIGSLEEFSEVLILIQRFNKANLGEFFISDKSPNDQFQVTQAFMSKLDMRNEELIPSLRFLLSLVQLPNQNWDNIINYFSKIYYNDNKSSPSSFKSEEEITQLCLFALEITKLRRNTHKVIEWNDFIGQYPDYNTINYMTVFKEIMSHPLPSFSPGIVNEEAFPSKDCNNNCKETSNSLKPSVILNTGGTANNCKVLTQKTTETRASSSEFLTLLKRGEVFRRRTLKGAIFYKVYALSNDELSITVRNNTCSCSLLSSKKILIASILHIFLGNCSMTHFEYHNHMTILTKNKAYELYHQNSQTILQWYNALSYIIKKSHSLSDLNQKHINQQNKGEYLSILWSDIVKNWEEYRDSLKLKSKASLSRRQAQSQKETICKKMTKNNPNECSSRISKEQLTNLCSLGLPDWLRRDMWRILIENQLDISETLLAGYIQIIEEEKIMKPNSTISINLINHIDKLYQKYSADIQINESTFKENLYNIIRAFCLYRPDVLYSKQIAYFAIIFYIWSSDFIEAFVHLCNFIVPNCFFKFLIKDEEMANESSSFFNCLLKKYVPNLCGYLMKYNFHLNVFFAKWAGYLFTTFFDYEIVLRIWDNFIFKGSRFIYEVALAVMILQEKDLLKSSNSTILENLRHFPKKYTENELFELIDKIDITEDYERHFTNYELAKEKGELFFNF